MANNTTSGDVGIKFNAETGGVETGVGKVNRGLDSVKRKAEQVEKAVNKGGAPFGMTPSVFGKMNEGLSKITKNLTGIEGIFYGAGAGGLLATGAIALFNGIISNYKQKMEEARKVFEEQQKTATEQGGKARSVPGINNQRFNRLISLSEKMGTPITGDEIGELGGKLLKLNKKATDEQLVEGIYAQRQLNPSAAGGDKLVAQLQAMGLGAGNAVNLNELAGNNPEELTKALRRLKGVPEGDRLFAAGDIARQIGMFGKADVRNVDLAAGRAALNQQRMESIADPVAALNRIQAGNEVYKKNYAVKRNVEFAEAAKAELMQRMKDPIYAGMSRDKRSASLSADVADALGKNARWAEFFQDGNPNAGAVNQFFSSTGARMVREMTKAMYQVSQTQNNAGVNLAK